MHLFFSHRTLQSSRQQNILEKNARAFVQQLKLVQKWVMKQDSKTKHTSKSTSEWLKKKIKVLEWPREYLNPTEMLLKNLKRQKSFQNDLRD